MLLIKDDTIARHFTNYITAKGYSGTVVPTSGRYLDDLPGISLTRAADIASDLVLTGRELIEKCINNAIHETIHDFVGQLASKYQFKNVIADAKIQMAGKFTWYGLLDTSITFRVSRGYDSDGFKRLVFKNFEIVSDRAVQNKVFYVQTDMDDEKSITVDLVSGRNVIPIEIDSRVEYAEIIFDISDFQLGRREYYKRYGFEYCKCNDLTPDGLYFEYRQTDDRLTFEALSNMDVFGFNATVQETCDMLELACYFSDLLIQPVLYKSGVNFLLEAMNSDRVNPYTANGKEDIDKMLLMWTGGTDMVTGIKTGSAYWRSLLQAVSRAEKSIETVDSSCITCSGLYISNSLPG